MIQKGEMVNVKVRIQGNKIDWLPAKVIAFGMYIHKYTHCVKITFSCTFFVHALVIF